MWTCCAVCARPRGISVEIVPMVQREGAPVSSSRIRACLEAGDVETAGAMLGEPYCIDLPVRHGKRLGTALGFPTINQIYPDWMLLPAGRM
ncbi:MAG: riboflavin kinase [Ruthenibacterium lactatiformans]